MHRVGPEGPDVAGGAGLLADPAEPVDKCRPVGVVREELPALNPPHDDMLESARRVNASLARHGARLAQAEAERDLYFFEKRADPASHRNALLMERECARTLRQGLAQSRSGPREAGESAPPEGVTPPWPALSIGTGSSGQERIGPCAVSV